LREPSPGALLARLAGSPHTRFPIYDGSIDNVVGIVHLRDLYLFARENPDCDLREILREVPVVPESMPVRELRRTMGERRSYVSVIFDEHGGTAGIVTMEDLIEEVFGEIRDEFDRSEEPEVRTLDDGSVLTHGQVLLEEINERYGTSLASGEFDTLAGLVIQELGRPPKEGDVVELNGTRLEVTQVEGLAISRVRVVPAREETSPEEPEDES
jgi:putative hemolysin